MSPTQRDRLALQGGDTPITLISDGHAVPFSKALLTTTLTATGLPPERALAVALDVEWQLLEGCRYEVSVDLLRKMVETVLGEIEGHVYLERYRRWARLAEEDRPIIVLIGGTTGVGKSTLATQLGERLGMVRLISTDTIREVMRAFFSRDLMPSIHFSSYDADAAVRIPLGEGIDTHVTGFMEQVEMVNVGVRAVLTRAIKERTSMIVEGVHMVPGMLRGEDDRLMEDALVLTIVVAVKDPELHRAHFMVRERETSGRRAVIRYLQRFDDIRRIQEFVLRQAANEGTLVIDNVGIDETVGTVVEALYDLIERTEGQGETNE
jgi:2-phosphoglycerate kinase